MFKSFISTRSKSKRQARFIEAAHYIATYSFPLHVIERAQRFLDDTALPDARRGLKNYFVAHAHHLHTRKGDTLPHLAMPSQDVDALWHEFILNTADYARFCERAFGQMLHHVPAPASQSATREAQRAASARSYLATQAARADLEQLAPASLARLGGIASLFAVTGAVSAEFPFQLTMIEIEAEAQRLRTSTASAHSSGSTAADAGVCFGHCGDGGEGRGAAWGGSQDDGGGSDSGGDGGGGDGGGGGCGS